MIKHHIVPASWIIILIIGFPLFSETAYAPALPDIAQTLRVRDALVEYTLTIYMFGMALGMLLWGYFSDIWGRKPCLIIGFCIFLVGCGGCYFSSSIEGLMISRLVQAMGGSVGSVLGQTICRDVFHGPELGKIYSLVGSALGIFPAMGPIIGGLIDEHYGWPSIFLFLIGSGVLVILMITWQLPETHHAQHRVKNSLRAVLNRMSHDPQVIGYGLLAAAGNGIAFSYYAEGPFFMIEILHLTPSQFGLSFLGIGIAYLFGGMLSRYLHHYFNSKKIMNFGLVTLSIGTTALFLLVILFNQPRILIWGCIMCMPIIFAGQIITLSNAFSLALVRYKDCIGTASSLFGFSYFSVVALFTYGMGFLHNDTVYAMPIYFCGIMLFMIFINNILLKGESHDTSSSETNHNAPPSLFDKKGNAHYNDC